MTASTLVGLAILPPSFFLASYLSSRMQVFQFPLNLLGITSLCIFFSQAMTEIPSMSVPLAYCYYGAIALLILYVVLEGLGFISMAMTTLLQTGKNGRRD